MAQREPPRKGSKAASREAYRRDFEERRAKKLSKTLKVKPFDPAKFVEGMRIQAWATIHTIIYAGALTAGLILVGRAAGAQAIGAFAALLSIGSVFYYLLRVWGLDIREIGRTTAVVGIWLTYFVTWLMASFLMSNLPVIDEAPPEIHNLDVFVLAPNATWVHSTFTATNAIVNDTAQVRFRVTDNSAIPRVTFSYRAWNATDPTAPVDLQPSATGDYTFTFTALSRVRGHSYGFIIEAWDAGGLRTERSESLSIDEDAWPVISEVAAFVQAADGSWVASNFTALDAAVNDTAQVHFHLTDNDLRTVNLTFSWTTNAAGQASATDWPHPDDAGNCVFTFTHLSRVKDTAYSFHIAVVDARGQTVVFDGALSIQES